MKKFILIGLLTAFILFIANALLGNPITKFVASHAANRYLTEHYEDLDLVKESANFNFKDGSYNIRVYSMTSIDTAFTLYYESGEIIRDSYDDQVDGRVNTLNRLSTEYAEHVQSILNERFELSSISVTVMYDKSEYEKPNKVVLLDMPFETNLPIQADLTINADITHDSIPEICLFIEQMHAEMIRNDCYFTRYHVAIEKGGSVTMLNGITADLIESGNLLETVEKIENNSEVDGIYLYKKSADH